jgi:hypothetical protein
MEGVANGSAEAKHVAGVEVGVIYDAVEVGLGTDKKVSPHGIANADANVHEKMRAVHSRHATSGKIAKAILVVEKYGLSANAGHEVGGCSLRHMGREYRVDIVKKGTIFLEAVVEMPLVHRGEFCTVAEMILKNADDADARVDSILLWRRQVSLGSAGVLGGVKFAGTKGNVKLLSTGESGNQSDRTHG